MAIQYYISKKADDAIGLKNRLFFRGNYPLVLFLEFLILPLLLIINSFINVQAQTATTSAGALTITNELAKDPNDNTDVLGEEIAITPTPQITTTKVQTLDVSPTVTATPSLPPAQVDNQVSYSIPKKQSYTIAIIGDSMVDTMGERLEYLEHVLTKRYPRTDFHLYNYGKGAQNVEDGLARFDSDFNYSDRHYPSLPQLHPDILIVGSFAYNPFSPYDRNQHWVSLTTMVEKAKGVASQVYMLAEIAPLRSDFGKGPGGVNWDSDTAYVHSGHIIEQLENAVGLSKDLGVPIIDAFHPSGGNRAYVNSNDGIHASVSGHEFTAGIIASRLAL